MRVRVWRYRVSPEAREEFEREYGPLGSWASLFAGCPGFIDTALYADVTTPGCYLTVDRFVSDQAWMQFRTDNHAAYSELDLKLAHLTRAQEELV